MTDAAWSLVARAIIYVSWPGLLVGTIIIMRDAIRFRRAIRNEASGRLVLAMTVGWLVALFCLGFVATSHLLRHGTKDDVWTIAAIFLVSVCVFGALLAGVRRWNREVVELNGLYVRLEQMVSDRTAELEAQHKRCDDLIASLRNDAARRQDDLQAQIEKIDDFNRVMVSREVRMMELKMMIAKLKGEPVQSISTAVDG